MTSLFQKFLNPTSSSSASSASSKSSRRKSEVATTSSNLQNDIALVIEALGNENVSASTSSRRHSMPEAALRASGLKSLDTIEENENLPIKSNNLAMNLSPTQRNSPKEKRTFTFFRSRTLSSSSNESNGGGGGGAGVTNNNGQSTSPRLSPRSLFDKVRKRSQSDVKAQTSLEHVNGNGSSNQNQFQQTLQQKLQQQQIQQLQNYQQHLQHQQQQQQQQQQPSTKKFLGPQVANVTRKHLSHSISEEKDEYNESNSEYPDFTESNYKTYHGESIDIKSIQASSPDKLKSSPRKNSNSTDMSSVGSKRTSHMDKLNMPYIFVQKNNQIFSYFMKHKCCYDIMPKSAKIVVFDTQLLVKKAFFALIYNGVRAAPLWDSKNQKFVGMLTITDFILILQKYYKEANAKIEELEEHRLETWREVLKEYRRPFIYLKPEDTLFEAIKVLTKNRVHRLPIIDPQSGNVVCIVTHKRILRYLYLFIYDMPQPQFLQQSISELKVGSYDKITTIKTTAPIYEALNIFVNTRVSALPVVDENQRLVNIYSKFDVIDLAAEKTYTNLDVTVLEALEYRRNRFDGVASCTKNESLGTIMERIVNKEVHRLVIVDEEKRVIGIVSLSDILTYIILKQDEQTKDLIANKTASLTAAFGLTRLSSTTVDHVNLNSINNEDSKLANSSSSNSSNVNMNDSNVSSNSRTSSPLTATINQPQSSTIDQAIFEDDPMETEPVK